MSYIDTQGMTLDDPYDKGKVFKGDPETYPSFKSNKIDLFSPLARKELKEIINEVLDERLQHNTQHESDEWLYRGTY